MESPRIVYKYYSNPAFCGQSEIQKCRTTQRMSPIGANSPRKIKESSNRIVRTDISDNPLRLTLRDSPPELPPKPPKFQNRSFQRQASLICKSNRSSVRCRTRSEDLEMAQFKRERRTKYDRNAESDDGLEESRLRLEESRLKHRYEVIADDFDDLVDYSPTKKRIVQVPSNEIIEYNVDGPDENELQEIPSEIVKTVNGKTLRYAIVPSDEQISETPKKCNVTFSSPIMPAKNLIATQKLHELLSTPPRKLKSYASQPSVRITPNKSIEHRYNTPKSIVSSTPQVTPSKSCANLSLQRQNTSPISPKAQQKLNYGLPEHFERHDVFVTSFRKDRSFEEVERSRDSRRSQKKDKTTAVISPRVAAPPSDTFTEETYKSINSLKAVNSATASLTIAALMLTLCGGLTSGLSFYMMYSVGRRYYLDFGALSGFTCFVLGLLGCRSRRHHLLPNRNFVSGYIVLSSFALLSAFGLLLLLTVQPKPGTPLNDITSGAVCGVSILCLFLATLGVLTSYCCARDPPDNRVGTVRWY